MLSRNALVRIAWAFAIATLLVCGLRMFVGDVFHVDSSSMEPTIHGLGGGEWVFVRYDVSPPARYEIVVARLENEEKPVVKRVAGLPFERVQITNGDLWIDGAIARPSEQARVRPPLVTVFDQRWQAIEESFHLGSTELDPWKHVEDAWRVDASTVPAGSDGGLMDFVPNIGGDYLGLDHMRIPGEGSANDLVVECEVLAEANSGRLRVVLTEQGDLFELVIAPAEGAPATATLTRCSRNGTVEELARASLPFATQAWHQLRLSNLDNELVADVDGSRALLHASYERNVLHPADRLREGKSIAPRVRLGAESGVFRFRGVRIQRDLFYTARGEHGTKGAEELGSEQYFLLGDNSPHSRDSREWGPVRRATIVGRASCVVWPPARWRWLDRPEE